MRTIILTAIFFCFSFLHTSMAQSSTLITIGDLNQNAVDRMMIMNSDFGKIHSAVHAYNRKDIVEYLAYLKENSLRISHDSLYIFHDNNDNDSLLKSKKSILKFFYRTPAHLFETRTKHFYFNVNPLLDIQAGVERYNGDFNFTFFNRRGVQIRGNIADKVYFYTDIIETQASFPTYITNRIIAETAVPGAGFYKPYDSRFTPAKQDGFDYLMSQGYVGFQINKFIGVQFGHGRHFIGDGHRSLLLSDFSNNYFYLKLNTKIWKLNYQNIFAELTQDHPNTANQIYPKKYMAAHHLSINILKNLNVGLFESVIFSRSNGIEFQYLNPLILYRTIEQMVGSPDNVILGFNFRYDFLKRFSLYGQVVIDEFVLNRVFAKPGSAESGWWANKQGYQIGLKYVQVFGIKGLDLQTEFNTVRPYTYAFRDSTANYTHYNQPLAHPLGANFIEAIGIVKYQPLPQLFFRAQVNFAQYGSDTLDSNWGKNIHLSYRTIEKEFGNQTTQGVKTQLLIFQFMASYMIKHNLSLDLLAMYRDEKFGITSMSNQSLYISAGLRWNLSYRMNDW